MSGISSLKVLADSQLEHVLLALRSGDRAFNVRDVLDPWWCFERGQPFVARRRDGGRAAIQFNKPCAWELRDILPHFDWMSDGAKVLMEMGEAARIEDRKSHPKELSLVVDHSVPLAHICNALWADRGSWRLENLRDFLGRCFRRAVITYDENRRLDTFGLRSKMPRGWRLDDDPFARYREAHIVGAPKEGR
ncbi:MAG: hypothetical protein KAY22_11230 [Rhizorhabdus sp.]|uniref:hypothetical protein n=1 Tax=Rhizorhabdus sp. TaxID=1968843 RepID=UPI001B3DD698|nr:hypothetical protein [Rhizorhabdus sp.]MBP8232867.1 hypothetical protein [Rhizorhabdus sp.]